MKKFLNLLLICLLVVLSAFASCAKDKEPLVVIESDTCIVITVSNEQMEIDSSTTLLDYMNSLKSDEQINFTISNGMINSINGIENPQDYSSCWMLYTSDSLNANDAWGTAEYNGEIYGSAVVGAESLIVKNNCIYIWVYQSF